MRVRKRVSASAVVFILSEERTRAIETPEITATQANKTIANKVIFCFLSIIFFHATHNERWEDLKNDWLGDLTELRQSWWFGIGLIVELSAIKIQVVDLNVWIRYLFMTAVLLIYVRIKVNWVSGLVFLRVVHNKHRRMWDELLNQLFTWHWINFCDFWINFLVIVLLLATLWNFIVSSVLVDWIESYIWVNTHASLNCRINILSIKFDCPKSTYNVELQILLISSGKKRWWRGIKTKQKICKSSVSLSNDDKVISTFTGLNVSKLGSFFLERFPPACEFSTIRSNERDRSNKLQSAFS